MKLDEKTIQRIGKLARIRLSDDEVNNYASELTAILDWVEQLQEVNTDDIEPMAGVGDYQLRLCDDEVTDGDDKDAILENAPNTQYDCFTVPKVVE